jgi:hypothetical protein
MKIGLAWRVLLLPARPSVKESWLDGRGGLYKAHAHPPQYPVLHPPQYSALHPHSIYTNKPYKHLPRLPTTANMPDIVKVIIATSATEEDNTPVNYSDGGRESLSTLTHANQETDVETR